MGQRLGGLEALLEGRNDSFALLSLQSWSTGSGVGHGLWISDASGIRHERVPVGGGVASLVFVSDAAVLWRHSLEKINDVAVEGVHGHLALQEGIYGMRETGESKSAMQEHLREGLLHRGSSRRSVLSSKRRALSTGSARCRAVAATSLGLAVTTTGGAVLRLSARTMASRACVSALHSS